MSDIYRVVWSGENAGRSSASFSLKQAKELADKCNKKYPFNKYSVEKSCQLSNKDKQG